MTANAGSEFGPAARPEAACKAAAYEKSQLRKGLNLNSQETDRDRGFPPHQAPAALRVRRGQPAEGGSAQRAGADIIDLGMGNPDLPTPQHIVDKLVETVAKPRTHRYSASKGIPGLRRAQAAYYERRFGVKLDPETQVVATLGSKEGFANMAQAITAPGDVVLVPEPDLSDPRVRLPDGRRRHALTCRPAERREFLRAVERAVRALDPEADRAGVVAIRRTRRRWSADLDFYTELSLSRRSTT